jgi:hypothetical protein
MIRCGARGLGQGKARQANTSFCEQKEVKRLYLTKPGWREGHRANFSKSSLVTFFQKSYVFLPSVIPL